MSYIVCFNGVDHKCGTSMISQCVAEKIASDNPGKAVILVHAEQGPGQNYSPNVRESLEHIRPYLAEKLIDKEELLSKCVYKENLYIMGGASRPGSNYLYTPDMAEYLAEALCQLFDYVICDTGSDIEHGMCIGMLFKANLVYRVITQSESAISRYEWISSLFSHLNLNIRALIINNYDSKELNSSELISERLNIEKDRIICVKKSVYGKRAEEDSKSLLTYKDKSFSRDINLLCRDIYLQENKNV